MDTPSSVAPVLTKLCMKNDSPVSLTNVMDLLLDAVCVVDASGCFIFVSAAFERIFGYSPAEVVGRPMIELVWPEDRAKTLRAVDEIVAGKLKPHFENRYVRKDGRVVHIMWSARWSETDRVRIAVARDITERKRAESMQAALYDISEAAHTAEDLMALFKRIHCIVGELLPARNFLVALGEEGKDQLTFSYMAKADAALSAPLDADESAAALACKLNLGTLSAAVIRCDRPVLLTPDDRAALPEYVQSNALNESLDWLGVPLRTPKGIIGALVVQNQCGDARYTEADMGLLQFVSTQIAAAIERKQIQDWLQYAARHDALTDLPNRELFHDRLRIALASARREQTHLSLLYIDLDMFKQINDSLGHAVGDLLLQEVASRLKQCVRDSDTVGRVGGDEFLLLLNNIQFQDHALLVAEKVRATLSQPFELSGQRLNISPSIGIALYPEHGDDYLQLIRYADEAMYDAKKSGGNSFRMTVAKSRPPDKK